MSNHPPPSSEPPLPLPPRHILGFGGVMKLCGREALGDAEFGRSYSPTSGYV
jgi:hypothetical protein